MVYQCRLLDSEGKIINQYINAENDEELKRSISQQGFTLIRFRHLNIIEKQFKVKRYKQLSTKEILYFCQQFNFVFKAKLNVLNGLQIIKDKTKNKKMKEISEQLYNDIEEGKNLSDSMRSLGNVFPPLFINMIAGGEVSGNLEKITSEMHTYYKQQMELQQKLKSAMIQPIILVIMTIALLVFFIYFALPDLMSNLEIERNQLPLLTQIVMGLSDFITNYILYIIASIFVLLYIGYRLSKIYKVKYYFHHFSLKIPLIGKIIRESETYRIAMTLNIFLNSGMQVIPALEEIQNIASNELAVISITSAKQKLLEGGKLYEGFSNNIFFDDTFLKFIQIGEETGHLDEILEQTSMLYNEQLNKSISDFLKMLEPTITIVIGIFIGIMVMSIALPVFNMINYVKV